MIKHYLKIAFRNMRKYKTQSLIGIFGLAFGLACFVPALYWLRYETSYDSFYPDAERIYRVYSVEKESGKVNELVSEILAKKLHDQFPATEASTVFFVEQDNYNTDKMPQVRLLTLHTDSTFFQVFQQEFVSGNVQQSFQTVHNMVITETMAIRLFGNVENAIGQQIQSKTFFFFPPYTITAVVKDPPSNSNLPFDAILFSEILKSYTEMSDDLRWSLANMQVYVRLHPHAVINEFAKQLHDFSAQLEINPNNDFRILPVADIRHKLNEDAPFTLNFIRLFTASAILLIICALFNFLNLYLNLFHQRIRELRQRAVHGAKNRQLIMQMIFELTYAILLALTLAFCLIILTSPVLFELLGITMEIKQLVQFFAVGGTGIMVFIQLIAIIPFWQLSRLSSYKSQVPAYKKQEPMLRHMAVTLQLIVSIVLIVAALVVTIQMRFVNYKDLGFDSAGIIQLSGLTPYRMPSVQTSLMHELTAIPQVENVTEASFEPQHNTFHLISEVEWPGKETFENPAFHLIETDSRFAETFKLKMLMGEWWDEGIDNKIVLNEEAVRVMGLSEPIGAIIRVPSNYFNREGFLPTQEYEVVGVVNDFHTLSLRSRIYPTIIQQFPSSGGFLYICAVSGQDKEAMQRITEILPDIDASFANVNPTPLNELYDRLNRSEQAGMRLFSVLATVCLLISLIGVFAVAVDSTQRRRKEIAIRKVFGAEVRDIVRIFFREYTLQVIVAGVIALPIAYYAMHQWLQGYAYRTNIPLWLLVGVIIVLAAVVLLTVLGQIWKAANQNPAEVVKSE